MLDKLKSYLLLGCGLLLISLIVVNLYGVRKVWNRLDEVANMRVEVAGEKVVAQLADKQKEAITKINQAGEDSTARLQEILSDAQNENTERSQPAPSTNVIQVVNVPSAPVVAKATPRPTPQAKVEAVPKGPSATTTRTIDELWNNYCTTFPTESSCDRQTATTRGVSPSTATR
jgi:hypothetical protein